MTPVGQDEKKFKCGLFLHDCLRKNRFEVVHFQSNIMNLTMPLPGISIARLFRNVKTLNKFFEPFTFMFVVQTWEKNHIKTTFL